MNDRVIDWINANKMDISDISDDIEMDDTWYQRALDDLEEEIIQHYGDCDIEERTQFNLFTHQAVTEFIEGNYEDIIRSPFYRDVWWEKFRGPVEDMDDLLELQKFVTTQYNRVQLLGNDSPYWGNVGIFTLFILSPVFIRDLVEERVEPRLGEYHNNANKYHLKLDEKRGLHLNICQDDYDDLKMLCDNIENDYPAYREGRTLHHIIKFQAIVRGRNTRWRVPLHLLTIS